MHFNVIKRDNKTVKDIMWDILEYSKSSSYIHIKMSFLYEYTILMLTLWHRNVKWSLFVMYKYWLIHELESVIKLGIKLPMCRGILINLDVTHTP